VRPVGVNLASRPFQNNLLFYAGYGIAITGILAFTVFNGLTLVRHSRTVAELNGQLVEGRAALDELQSESVRLRKEIGSRNIPELSVKIQAANEVLLEREFSWTRLLNALEEALPYKVRLLELRPVVTPEGVLIQARGIARDLENFWMLQQHLQDHAMFRRVYPTGYAKQPGGGEFIFTISFNYFPDPQEAPPEGQQAAVTPDTLTPSKARRLGVEDEEAAGEAAGPDAAGEVPEPEASGGAASSGGDEAGTAPRGQGR